MQRPRIAFGILAAALLTAHPALADGGLSAAIVTAVKYSLKFISSASSNAAAEAHATAVSTVGTTKADDTDTGFFSATANAPATSGDLAQQTSFAFARYHFLGPNEEKVRYTPRALHGPEGLSIDALAATKIKRLLQVLVETIAARSNNATNSVIPLGDFTVPINLQFDLDGYSSYQFDVSLEGEDGSIIDLANGSAGVDGKSIALPWLESIDPDLAMKVSAQYLSIVSGKGSVSFYLGQGLLPTGADGNAGMPVSFALDTPFGLNSELSGNRAQAIPEPATWALMLVGFGLLGGAMRRENSGRWTGRVRDASSSGRGVD